MAIATTIYLRRPSRANFRTMPIYEYSCRACHQDFERRLNVQERHSTQTCPSCGAQGATLRMSAPSLLGARAKAEGMGTCPTSGMPCGCAHAIRN